MIRHVRYLTLILSLVSLVNLAQTARANWEDGKSTANLAPAPGSDFPPFELSAGYNYIRADDGVVDNLHGFEISGFVNIRPWLGFGGEFMAGWGSDTKRFFSITANTTEDRYVYVFGPRLKLPISDRFTVFGQALFGGAHVHAHASNSFFGGVSADADAFAMALGGGIDLKLTQRLTWRMVEADYLRMHFNGGWEDDFQASTALVFTFGR